MAIVFPCGAHCFPPVPNATCANQAGEAGAGPALAAIWRDPESLSPLLRTGIPVPCIVRAKLMQGHGEWPEGIEEVDTHDDLTCQYI